ncbi:protein lifeguard 3-like isoform X1 [Rhineura floridana]|uniref:protein lifeguard 3-like isoform X1 n=1 Tax=Rhineura floridana TaxID=261503 RepID=UPI002AC83AA7|nr:protein lifeguard 3-like isoform X1 [Rhineura floridana]
MPDISPPPYDDKKTGAEDESCVVEEDGGFRIAYWVDKNVRQTFIRKVYSIITLQLLMTVGIVAVFTFARPVSFFVRSHIALYYISYFIFLICYFVLVFCRSIQRRFPWNIILMTIFTMAMGFMTCAIASTYDSKSVILAMIITAIVTIIVTVFSFQTKVDITSWRGFFCILAIVLTVTSIVTAIVLTCKYMYWLHMLYSAISAIAFTLFLAYDTQLLLGDKKYAISPEDYIYGAIQIYVDVIYIFLSFTRLVSRN